MMIDNGSGAGYVLQGIGRGSNRNIFGAIATTIARNPIDDAFRLQPLRRFDIAIRNNFRLIVVRSKQTRPE